jgi:hypothetical protein
MKSSNPICGSTHTIFKSSIPFTQNTNVPTPIYLAWELAGLYFDGTIYPASREYPIQYLHPARREWESCDQFSRKATKSVSLASCCSLGTEGCSGTTAFFGTIIRLWGSALQPSATTAEYNKPKRNSMYSDVIKYCVTLKVYKVKVR